MERKILIKIMFIVFVAAVTIFSVVGISKAVEPLTIDSLDGFTDIGGSTNTANNTVNNTVVNNTVNTTNTTNTTNKVNNATQSNTAIPKTGSNSLVVFISGMMILAITSVISICLYNRIKLS